MVNASTYNTCIKIVTTTYSDETSTTLDLKSPGVSIRLDMLQLLKNRMPEANWPGYFNIGGTSKNMQKYREGETFDREAQTLQFLDDAVHEIVSILASASLRAENNYRSALARGIDSYVPMELIEEELARFDRAIGIVKVLNIICATDGIHDENPEAVLHAAVSMFKSYKTIGDLKKAARRTPLTDPLTRH